MTTRLLDGDPADDLLRELRFRRALVATGARPVLPPVPGLAEAVPAIQAGRRLSDLAGAILRLLVRRGA